MLPAGENGEAYQPTARSKVKRLPARGTYDCATVHSILNEAFICHVGFMAEDGHPVVIPTAFARVGERLYLHGSIASRMLKILKGGAAVSVTVTLLDGLVLARSVFHHSMNYRSVTVFGSPEAVLDPEEKRAALEAIVEHIVPGRSAELEEVSAKVRTGPPKDDVPDYELPIWAGVLPVDQMCFGTPLPDPKLPESVPVPQYIAEYQRQKPLPAST